MKRFKSILVATDTELETHPIVDQAGEIALQNSASLKIVDVLRTPPRTARFLVPEWSELFDLMIAEKQKRLEALALPLRNRGVNVTSKLLQGEQSVEIIQEVLRDEHDLVLRVAKGSHSKRKGYFGTTATELLRKCPCPVWLVSPKTKPTFKHILGCVDTSSTDPIHHELRDRVFELSSSISEYQEGRLSLLHTWALWNKTMLQWHVKPEELEQWEQNERADEEQHFREFLERHGRSIHDDNVHLINGEPIEVIPQFVRENGVDLLVIGTVGRAGVQGMIMGNTSEMLLSEIECSLLGSAGN